MKAKKPQTIKYSPTFLKQLKKLPKSQLKPLAIKEAIFRDDPFDPRLKTHTLHGSLEGFYAFSISYHWRIIFHYERSSIILDAVDTHTVYR